jgi:hypothetical protein
VAENKSDSPIQKGLTGPGLLAHVAVNKYADHIPLHRQEAMLRRMGVDIRRSTLADWMADAAHLLLSLQNEIKAEVLRSKVIHIDETPVTVQEKGRSKPKIGRVWAYWGDRNHPYAFYEYSPDRKAVWPEKALAGWTGVLQADAYRGYDALYGRGITEAACWAHARRKFVEAEKSNRLPALEALVHIRELYRVEKDIRKECEKQGMSLDDPGERGDKAVKLRCEHRQKHSIPLLDAFGEWLKGKDLGVVLPKSPLGEAMTYCRNNWTALKTYASDGELSIDNNAAERALRPVAVGRKNYLFFGSDRGGETAATLYSVIASAKRHGLDPWKYIRDLFARLPRMNVSALPELLPDRWKTAADSATPAIG